MSKISLKTTSRFDPRSSGFRAVQRFAKELTALSEKQIRDRVAQVNDVEWGKTRTADGAPIVPGMYVYRAVSANTLMRRQVGLVCANGFYAMHGTFRGPEPTFFYSERFWSTPALAFVHAEES